MKGMSLLPCAAVMLMSGIAISDVHAQSTGGNALFAYPTRGQTPEQQAADRAACHEWAVAQTGHDPSLVFAAQQAGVHNDVGKLAGFERAELIAHLDVRCRVRTHQLDDVLHREHQVERLEFVL